MHCPDPVLHFKTLPAAGEQRFLKKEVAQPDLGRVLFEIFDVEQVPGRAYTKRLIKLINKQVKSNKMS